MRKSNTVIYVCKLCGSDITGKKSVVRVFCGNKCKSEWQRTQKPISRELLVNRYVDEKMSANQIAKLVNRDAKTVWFWLKDFGIPTRRRGRESSPQNSFKKGQPSLFKGKKHSEETRKKLSEIAKADGRVPYDPKVGPYLKGKKGSDTTNWKGGVTPERQSLYSSEAWKRAVKAVWKRENGKCQRCGKAKKEHRNLPFALHHLYTFAENKRLRAHPDNLALLCRPCHLWVHSKKNKDRDFLTKPMELPEWLKSSSKPKAKTGK